MRGERTHARDVLKLMVVAIAGVCAARAMVNVHAAQTAPLRVSMRVDASARRGALPRAWRFFGADEPNFAYMKDGRALLARLGALAPKQVYFRAHNLLTSGDGSPGLKWGSTNAYREDAQGRPIYDWTIVDRIFDTYLQNGVRPYVEIGFMPEALSTHPQPYRHSWSPTAKYSEIFTGWAYPPKDWDRWRDLVGAWVAHCVERYGPDEVGEWYWEVWNEPNIGYWQGTPEEFHRLHDYAIDGVRRAFRRARVGGPDVAGDGGDFTRGFLEHVLRGTNYATGQRGTPIDFVSFHAKGQPSFVDGHVRTGIANQLTTISKGFDLIASFPELKGIPVVIGESDPDGCAACQGPQLGYRNGTMYSSYTAAAYARTIELAAQHGVNLTGALTWAFEFEDQPYFAGFRALATNGIPLPVLGFFELVSRMGGERLAAVSDGEVPLADIMQRGVRATPDVGVLASGDAREISILTWHYHDDDVPGPEAEVDLVVEHLPVQGGEIHVEQYRVDATHGNAYTAWKAMGSPSQPTDAQRKALEAAAEALRADGPASVTASDGRATLKLTLPRQAVSLVRLTW